MRRQEQAELAPPSISGGPLPASPRDASRARVGLRVDVRTTPPGEVSLEAIPDHRLKVHAGAPVRGACRTQRFVYTRGDLDIFPAGQSDVWEEEATNTSLVVRLAPALMRRAAEDMGLNPERAGLQPRYHFRDARIEHVAWALESEREEGHPGGLLYTESLGLALAFHLLGRYPAPLEGTHGLAGPRLKRVTEYIEEHLDRNLSLARLSAVAGVSESHFRALFKRSTGLPVHEYVIQRRVERARTLLLRGDLPASQVALEAGFSHQSHMARCMRRVLGVTPRSLARGVRAR